ncbi:hypothetical protein N7495_006638 [Penicillium taxi]|uniref:uncharacterized protein n=1 Tax=Penicillium taxi TaxID=168475 RepID=UPI00254573AA|nr:uncharacterized protein N7495_006638 [Penicillium taxi]KAJ5894947.1 hypothetical protein N7495_006638 [Penicillium taxi]
MTLSQAQLHSFLWSLFQHVNNLEADFPSPEILQALEIQAFQVSLDTAKYEILKFNPCFFEPQPGKLFQMYPLNPMHLEWDPGDSMKLSHLPSVRDIMDRALENPPPKENDPSDMDFPTPSTMWELVSHYWYTDHPRKPHSVLSCISTICPTKTGRGITTHELCVIVYAMLLRVNHKPFSTCHIHPVRSFACNDVMMHI